jgi:hypothetical protein
MTGIIKDNLNQFYNEFLAIAAQVEFLNFLKLENVLSYF